MERGTVSRHSRRMMRFHGSRRNAPSPDILTAPHCLHNLGTPHEDHIYHVSDRGEVVFRGISRRTFIKLVGGAALAGTGLWVLSYFLGRIGLHEPVSREEYSEAAPPTRGEKSTVSIVRGRDVGEMVRRAVEALGGVRKVVKPGSRVLIKPNVGFNRPEAVTSPEVLRAVIEVVREADPREIVVAESAVRGYDTSSNFEMTGISNVARELNVHLIDLDRVDKVVKVNVEGKLLREVSVFKRALDADVIISVPKLKRHSQAVVTISLKNMMGVVPDDQKGMFHVIGLHQCIADLNTVVRPDLAIVDAIDVMTVSGPGIGKMVPGNAILASEDPVALDLVAAEYLFELEGHESPLDAAENIPHIKLAAELGIGTNDVSKIELIKRETN